MSWSVAEAIASIVPDYERLEQLERLARARERAMAVKVLPPFPPLFTCPVVGTSFVAEYPANAQRLHEVAVVRLWCDEPAEIPAELVRAPDNPHDPNAVEVHVPCLGDAARIGHLPRAVALRVARFVDRGGSVRAEVTGVRVHPDHPDRPGILLAVHRV